MFSQDDEFDLDVRLSGISGDSELSRGDAIVRPGRFGDGEAMQETVAPQATCPADTCGLDCQTQFGCETHGCNTSETCDQLVCSDAITFGPYCEDQTDDTCGCPEPSTGGCADPPD